MGKAANLVQAAGVPSLGDELNLAEDGIVGDGGDQGGIVESLADACQLEGARVMIEARSNLNPSMWYSVTQYLRQSTMNSLTTGWLQLNVLPQPE